MALKTAHFHVLVHNDEGELEVKTIQVAMSQEQWRVLHLIGNNGHNTDLNAIMRRAFAEAEIDYPTNIVAQVEGEDSLQTTDKANLQLAIAMGIIYVMNRSKLTNIDKYIVCGRLGIDGKIYPPRGISPEVLANVAAANGLKTLGATGSGADRKIDTLVGLVK